MMNEKTILAGSVQYGRGKVKVIKYNIKDSMFN